MQSARAKYSNQANMDFEANHKSLLLNAAAGGSHHILLDHTNKHTVS